MLFKKELLSLTVLFFKCVNDVTFFRNCVMLSDVKLRIFV